MLFVEARFFVFVAVVLAAYWALRGNAARKLLLLGCSLFFYGLWDWRFLLLLGASIAANQLAAIRIGRAAPDAQRARRTWLALSVAFNLGLLGFFKYFNFFVDTAVELLAALGVDAGHRTLDVVLPVGISFFTFQTMSYTIDVYRGKLAPARHVDVALFITFFPQLVAGPIVRASDFLPQLHAVRARADVQVRASLLLFLTGFFKKACIADNLAPFHDNFMADPAAFSAAGAWLCAFVSGVRTYCDFAGYSDMAIGAAGLFGYRLPQNFRHPYFATSPADLLRRWHITLSSWLKDYLYLPLVGDSRSRARKAAAVMLTMALGGLWHGASWSFLVWGAILGAAVVVDVALQRRLRREVFGAGAKLLGVVIGTVATYLMWTLAAVFFRETADFGKAVDMLVTLLTFDSAGLRELPSRLWLLFLVLAAVEFVSFRGWLHERWRALPLPLFAFLYGAAWALTLSLVAQRFVPYRYLAF